MDQDEFLTKLTAVVNLAPDTNGRGSVVESGPRVGSLKTCTSACANCGLLVERPPRIVYTFKNSNRTGKCMECKLIQMAPGLPFNQYYLTPKPKE